MVCDNVTICAKTQKNKLVSLSILKDVSVNIYSYNYSQKRIVLHKVAEDLFIVDNDS